MGMGGSEIGPGGGRIRHFGSASSGNERRGREKRRPFVKEAGGPLVSEGLEPKQITIQAKRLMRERRWREAEELLKGAIEDYPDDKIFCNMLISLYGKTGRIDDAREVFDEVVGKGIANVVTYSSMIDAYGKAGRVEDAEKVFDEVVGKGIARVNEYNAMIDAYGKAGEVSEARKVFDEVVGKGIANVFCYNAMIDAYGEAGEVSEARKVFDEAVRLRIADVVTYASMIKVYVNAEKWAKVDDVFKKMEEGGIEPDEGIMGLVKIVSQIENVGSLEKGTAGSQAEITRELAKELGVELGGEQT